MAETATKPYELDPSIFSPEAFELVGLPTMDGHRAVRLDIRFSGSGVLDRTSDDDLALLEAMRLGAPVRLIITGSISGKAYSLRTKEDEEQMSYVCTVRVDKVEAGELA
jgi:hypothetical protein